jgi:hypothetical protein
MTLATALRDLTTATASTYRQRVAALRAEVAACELEADESEEHARVLRDRALSLRAKWCQLIDDWTAETARVS